MPKETLAARSSRATHITDKLDAAMPDAEIELDYTTPLELLVSVLLAAQTTDKRVNIVSPALFAKFKTAADYAASTPAEIQEFIKTVGLFRNKSKALVALGKALVERHGGVVPTGRAALTELPGVGNKTAGVVSMHLKGDFAFPVDTHVFRLSRRMGLTRATTPDGVEEDLRKLLPKERWFQAHQLLVWHGRRVCHAKSPECHRCVAEPWCPRVGVPDKKKKLVRKNKA